MAIATARSRDVTRSGFGSLPDDIVWHVVGGHLARAWHIPLAFVDKRCHNIAQNLARQRKLGGARANCELPPLLMQYAAARGVLSLLAWADEMFLIGAAVPHTVRRDVYTNVALSALAGPPEGFIAILERLSKLPRGENFSCYRLFHAALGTSHTRAFLAGTNMRATEPDDLWRAHRAWHQAIAKNFLTPTEAIDYGAHANMVFYSTMRCEGYSAALALVGKQLFRDARAWRNQVPLLAFAYALGCEPGELHTLATALDCACPTDTHADSSGRDDNDQDTTMAAYLRSHMHYSVVLLHDWHSIHGISDVNIAPRIARLWPKSFDEADPTSSIAHQVLTSIGGQLWEWLLCERPACVNAALARKPSFPGYATHVASRLVAAARVGFCTSSAHKKWFAFALAAPSTTRQDVVDLARCGYMSSVDDCHTMLRKAAERTDPGVTRYQRDARMRQRLAWLWALTTPDKWRCSTYNLACFAASDGHARTMTWLCQKSVAWTWATSAVVAGNYIVDLCVTAARAPYGSLAMMADLLRLDPCSAHGETIAATAIAAKNHHVVGWLAETGHLACCDPDVMQRMFDLVSASEERESRLARWLAVQIASRRRQRAASSLPTPTISSRPYHKRAWRRAKARRPTKPFGLLLSSMGL